MPRAARNRDVLKFVAAIYDGVDEDERWQAALRQLSVALDTGVAIGLQNLPDRLLRLDIARLDPGVAAIFQGHYCTPETNAYVRRFPVLPLGEPVPQERLQPYDELVRTELYQNVYRPDRLRWCVAGLLLRERGYAVPFGFLRRRHEQPFDSDDLRFMRLLLPHLARAAALRLRLRALRVQRGAARDVLDYLPSAVVLVDAAGRILATNRLGEALIAAGDGIGVVQQRLVAAKLDVTRKLRRLVAEAAGAAAGLGTGGGLSLPRPSGLRPLTVQVMPLRSDRLLPASQQAAAAVFVGDPETRERVSEALLRELYGLTPSEAKVARLLLQQNTMAEAAKQLGVSPNTARTHLRNVLAKTGTRRQSELVRLLLRAPPGLSRVE